PIKREDLVPSDRLSIEIQNTTVLDISSANNSREVIKFDVSPFEEKDGIVSSRLSFDFLDYQDGSLVRILTDSDSADIKIKGTIIGMPEGIQFLKDSSGLRFPKLARVISLAFSILICY